MKRCLLFSIAFIISIMISAQNVGVFNGSSSIAVTTANSPTYLTDFTMSAWVKFSNLNGIHTIASWNCERGQIFFRTEGNVLHYYLWNGTEIRTTTKTPLVANTWYHFTVVVSNKVATIYVNGVDDTNPNSNIYPALGKTLAFKVGVTASVNLEWHNGWIDEFNLWSVAKKPNEISSIMNGSLTGAESNLNLFLDFENNITDKSVNHYSLSNTGVTYTANDINRNLSQTISFSALPTMTVSEQDMTLYATATSNLKVGFYSTNPEVATVVNGKLHAVGPGNCSIVAYQSGDKSYLSAVEVSQPIKVKSDMFKYVAVLNGTTDLTPTTTIPPFGSTFSLSAWIKPVAGGNRMIASWATTNNGNVGNFLRLQSDNCLHYGQWNGSYKEIKSQTAISSSVWTHIAIVKNNNIVTFYINGVPDNGSYVSGSAPMDNNTNGDNFKFGTFYQNNVSQEYFTGEMDNLTYFITARTDAEMLNEFENGISGNETGLWAHWNFNDMENPTSNLAAGSTNKLAINNGYVKRNIVNIPKTLHLNGTAYLKPVATIPPFGANFTISGWINPAGSGNRIIASWATTNNGNVGNFLRLQSDNCLHYGQWNGSYKEVKSNTTIPSAIWTHFAIVKNNNVITYYINGVADNGTYVTGASPMDNNTNGDNFTFGTMFQNNRFLEYFEGDIDNFSIFNVARSSADINKEFSTGLTGNETGIWGYWDFNDLQNPTADVSVMVTNPLSIINGFYGNNPETYVIDNSYWQAQVTSNASINALISKRSGSPKTFLFNTLGLLFNNNPVVLTMKKNGQIGYEGTSANLKLNLDFKLENDKFVMHCSAQNTGISALNNVRLSLNTGIDNYMDAYPGWNDKVFPTLMRCEKTHLWGYAMSPLSDILGIASPDSVSSYHLDYIFAASHRINSILIDLLQPLPVPARHPQTLSSLAAGETKEWNIYFKDIATLDSVKSELAKITTAPMFDIDLYTVENGQAVHGVINSGHSVNLKLETPDGTVSTIPVTASGSNLYKFTFTPNEGTGLYKLKSFSQNGKISEAVVSVRQPWSWYLKKARENAVSKPQRATFNVESWYGFHSMFLARKYFPDASVDAAVDSKFNEIFPLIYNASTNTVYNGGRVQNTSCTAGMMADRFEALGDSSDLKRAANMVEYLISKQRDDLGGGYYNGSTHYTSVIYVAKSIMEVALLEKELAKTSPAWKARYERHVASAKKAIDDLVARGTDVETEGEMTYEDGMIGCSATQIAYYALNFASAAERQKYIDAADKLVKAHQCLSQKIVPDSRMNGGSLRFWEANYDVQMGANFMNSPHGWSAWRIYHLAYMYLLTGDEDYLRQTYNALGSCVQLIDSKTGDLRWAFCSDPYLMAPVYQEKAGSPGVGERVSKNIGEQYVPMTGGWIPSPTGVMQNNGYVANDNDVHEIFKCMEEIALTTSYVVERADGTLVGYNCQVQKNGDTLLVTPNENVVDAIHFNLRNRYKSKVSFANAQPQINTLKVGLNVVKKEKVHVSNITKTTADVNWNKVRGVTKYKLHYINVGNVENNWLSVELSDTTKVLSSLQSGTSYKLVIQSDYWVSDTLTFQTQSEITNQTPLKNSTYTEDIRIFPTPANDKLSFKAPGNVKLVGIVNTSGATFPLVMIAKGMVDVSGLRSGLYFLKFMDDKRKTTNRRFIVK